MEPLITDIATVMPSNNLFTWFNALMGDVQAAITVIASVIAMIIALIVAAHGNWRLKAVIMGLICGGGFFFAVTGGVLWFGEQLDATITAATLLAPLLAPLGGIG